MVEEAAKKKEKVEERRSRVNRMIEKRRQHGGENC
jgi:hypothetical protein